MKLRILGNTLRMRLSQSEIAILDDVGTIKQQTDFGLGSDLLSYSIEMDESIEEPKASFEKNHIKIGLPRNLGNEWIQSDKTGIENREYTIQGEGLKLLIEKDFQCLHQRRNEDESDSFPNPKAIKE